MTFDIKADHKILILGANGQLGSRLVEVFTEQKSVFQNVVAGTRRTFDLSNPDTLFAALDLHAPRLILNAAAYTDVDGAERNTDLAFRVNRDSVAVLANWIDKNRANLVHFSTDYVFDGEKGDFYTENVSPNPINAYGRSKVEGENAILGLKSGFSIIRTSCLYDVRGTNFETRLRERIKNGATEIAMVTDVIGSPTFAPDLAREVYDLIHKNISLPPVLHRAGKVAMSRYAWAEKVIRDNGFSCRLLPVRQKDFPTAAARPKNTSLTSLFYK